MLKYKGSEGKLVPAKEAKKITGLYQNHKDYKDKPGFNYVEAEFFGLEKFQQLMQECSGTPVGFRVYYGFRQEDHSGIEPIEATGDKGKHTPRLVIIPVDSQGVDLTGLTRVGAMKDDSEEDGSALIGGPLCPKNCGR